MLLLTRILYYFNDLITFQSFRIPKSSDKTKIKSRINKTNIIFTRIETCANAFDQTKDARNGYILHLNGLNNLKKSSIDKNKVFVYLILSTHEHYPRVVTFVHFDNNVLDIDCSDYHGHNANFCETNTTTKN